MYLGKRANAPTNGAALTRRPSSRWQLVQFKVPPTYPGKLSRVWVINASPRYTEISNGSSGVLSTTGACHVSGFQPRVEGRCVTDAVESTRFDASCNEHAETNAAATSRRAGTRDAIALRPRFATRRARPRTSELSDRAQRSAAAKARSCRRSIARARPP